VVKNVFFLVKSSAIKI